MADQKLEVRYKLLDWRYCPPGTIRLNWFIGITCGYCIGSPSKCKGCLMCRPKEIELEQLFCWRDFKLGLDHVRQRPNDPDRRLVLADWLDDHGYYEIAELFRQSTTKMVGDVLTASR